MTDVPFITDAVLRGLEADRPAASVVGRLYFAIDSGLVYRDAGSGWNTVVPRSPASFDPAAGAVAGGWGYDATGRRVRTYDGLVTGSTVRALSVQLGSSDTLDAAVISTTETAFATSFLLPAGYLIANKALRITAMGQETTSGTPPTTLLRLRLQKAGPTNVNLSASTALAPSASLTNRGWGWVWVIQGTAPAGGAVSVECGSPLAFPAGFANQANAIAQPVTVDTASAQTIQLTQQYSANTAGNTITLRQLLVEELN